ncbi:response regulator transcription factor [Corynebacterium casei]|uniref:response regulator transcription factor n=1 Tax=Corynebacterium casei TaxID=160386 RepID=UPI00264746DF|nr:response regulator transcription factor [Corynebacterium casei]MDN5728729.1 response regulator transcription factor [Corynebacterium casei]MDN5740148.1 response regulator transcription factor [Corynebacterium casei]MDN5783640.1 response regulator transcription factor [Corynebacterium casei]MDN5840048.1 response regulator transcription factor [Corynebacterium casei]MDN5883617.1 response regulator transcription factor [Corynebacterium casei]
MSASILLVDDNSSIRESIPIYFRNCPEFQVVAAVESGRQALSWLQDSTCDIVLSDIHMPDMDGIELLGVLNKLPNPPLFIAMTAYDTDEAMLVTLSQGAGGYVLKDLPPSCLINAISEAFEGGISLSSDCVKRLVSKSIVNQPSLLPETLSARITSAEKCVAALVRDRKTNEQIADTLGYAEVTVRKRISTLMRKLGATNRTELAMKTLFR